MHLHPSPSAGASQCECILAELLLHAGEEVSLARLHVCSGSMAVHSRIAELRGQGVRILMEMRAEGRKRWGEYWLAIPHG